MLLVLFLYVILCCAKTSAKYIEGELKTSENWAFLARFCFLSQEGKFEYDIEFNEDQGSPNLLMYFDGEDQWPAVYKSNKTCQQKESVLSVELNQIVNLSAKQFYREPNGGCMFLPLPPTTPIPHYSFKLPTIKKNKNWKTTRRTTTVPTTTFGTTLLPELSTTSDYPETSTWFKEESSDFTTLGTTEITTTENTKNLTRRRRAVPTKKYSMNPTKFGRTINCHNARRFISARERWWFVAISNCNGTKGINIKYRILMTNGAPGDYWHEHFSADEFYILPVLMAFSIAYSFVMLGIVMCSVELKSRQLLHTTYKVFVLSVVLQLFGIMILSIVYLKYAVSGLLSTSVKRFAAILIGASETFFLMMLLLLAKGFTVTRGRLPLGASIKLTIFMCLYVVTYVSIFIYEAKVFDPGEVLYLYESPAGYALITLRMTAWCMFIYSTIFTLKHYPEKANFYYPFNIFGTLWFVAGPTFILCTNLYIDKWVRESIVCAVLLFISFGGHLMFLILTMPSVANKNFPYHVRTTQIGVMELTANGGRVSTIEQFSHHMYEPSAQDQTVIVPLTRRTEEIFEGMYEYNQRNKHLNSGTPSVPDIEGIPDATMANVLSWSLARNVPATVALPLSLPLPSFERATGNGSVRSNSDFSDDSANNGVMSRRNSMVPPPAPPNNAETSSFNDYIREVPIELFTISRMVVDKPSEPKTPEKSD